MIEKAIETVLFYLFSSIAVGLAVATVSTRRILRAAIYLMGVLSTCAAFYIMLNAEFLAAVQVLVYVGGIVVLLVFAVMLTCSTDLLENTPSLSRALVGLGAALGFFLLTVTVLFITDFSSRLTSPMSTTPTIVSLGRKFLDYGPTGYVLPFEVLSLLLLVATIGGIVIAKKTYEQKGARND